MNASALIGALSLILCISIIGEIAMATPWKPSETPDDSEGGSSLAMIKRTLNKRSCRWQAQDCTPYVNPCCPGLKCANYQGGYCVSKLQACICFPQYSVDMRD